MTEEEKDNHVTQCKNLLLDYFGKENITTSQMVDILLHMGFDALTASGASKQTVTEIYQNLIDAYKPVDVLTELRGLLEKFKDVIKDEENND